MPHGGPDWGTEGPLATVYTLQDMAELAARLGSINTFDRRGNVIFMDDFESGLNKWEKGGIPVGWAVTWESLYARNGGFSAKIVTDDSDGAWAQIYRYEPYLILGKLGVEFSFNVAADITEVRLSVRLDTGTRTMWAEIKYNRIDGILWYADWEGNWQPTGLEPVLEVAKTLFHTMKLVADFKQEYYSWVIINNLSADLSAYPLSVVACPDKPRMTVYIRVYNFAGAATEMNVDDVILTQNEP